LLVKAYSRRRKKRPTKDAAKSDVGSEIVPGLKEAIAWAGGEDVPARVTKVHLPASGVRGVRRRLGLSQSEFGGSSFSPDVEEPGAAP
jgi:hypothetical protein